MEPQDPTAPDLVAASPDGDHDDVVLPVQGTKPFDFEQYARRSTVLILGSYLFMILSVAALLSYQSRQFDQATEDRNEALVQNEVRRCEDTIDARTGLRALIDQVTAAGGGGGGSLNFTSLPEYQNLSPEDQAMWLAVTTLLASGDNDIDNNGVEDSSQDFHDFAFELFPIPDCEQVEEDFRATLEV